MEKPYWYNTVDNESRKYQCAFCGALVGSDRGYHENIHTPRKIYICPNCKNPTFFDGEEQYPASVFGKEISNLPQEIESLYNEARRCTGVNAYTASVLACRKLLMNIAVNKGAPENQSFIEYVEYLSNKNYVPPDGKVWVDHIRSKGNEANHEIALMKKEDAEDLITFIEMLLRLIYEFPSRVSTKTK